MIKLHITYPTPFWRDAGLSGTVFSPYELVHEAYDNTNHGDDRGTLVGFVSDERADDVRRLDAAGRRDRVLDVARPLLRRPGRWSLPRTTRATGRPRSSARGPTPRASTSAVSPGSVRSCVEPVGPIQFGSSDVAGLGFQHVDGALRVGAEMASAIVSTP